MHGCGGGGGPGVCAGVIACVVKHSHMQQWRLWKLVYNDGLMREESKLRWCLLSAQQSKPRVAMAA
jgi:hypothetical protein